MPIVLEQNTFARIMRAVGAVERNAALRMEVPQFIESPIYLKNLETTIIPAYGIVQVNGCVEEVAGGKTYLQVKRPFDFDSTQSILVVNGPREIEAEGFGVAQKGPVFRIKTNGTTLATDDRIGATLSSYLASLGAVFRVLGDDDIDTNIVQAVVDSTPCMGESISSIVSGSIGNVYMRKPTSGGWSTDTSKQYTAYNDTPTDIAGSKRLILFPVDGRFVAVEVC